MQRLKYASNDCWFCLCEVCTRIHCPKYNRRYSLDFCISMMLRERCPVPKCDYFDHKEKHKVLRFLRRQRRPDPILDKLASIENTLNQLAEAQRPTAGKLLQEISQNNSLAHQTNPKPHPFVHFLSTTLPSANKRDRDNSQSGKTPSICAITFFLQYLRNYCSCDQFMIYYI